MKINGSIQSLTTDKTTSTAANDRKASAGGAAAQKGDSISLSPLSAQLQALEANLATTSEFDRGKVEEIKQAIRDGRLQVNPEVIADRMLSHAMSLLGKDK